MGDRRARAAADLLRQLRQHLFDHPRGVFRRQKDRLRGGVARSLEGRGNLGALDGAERLQPAERREIAHEQHVAQPLLHVQTGLAEQGGQGLVVRALSQRHDQEGDGFPMKIDVGHTEQHVDVFAAGLAKRRLQLLQLRPRLLLVFSKRVQLGLRLGDYVTDQLDGLIDNRVDLKARYVDPRNQDRLLVDERGDGLGPGGRVESFPGYGRSGSYKSQQQQTTHADSHVHFPF